MADEAVLRIILQDAGGGAPQQYTTSTTTSSGTGQRGSGTSGGQSTSSASSNPPQQRTTEALDRFLEAEAKAALVVTRQHQRKDDRDQQLFELEAKALLDVTREQQAAAEEATRAEIVREDKDRALFEIEARAALDTARKQQAAAEEASRAETARQTRATELLEVEARAALDVVRRQQAAVEEARTAAIDLENRQRALLETEAMAALDVVRKQQFMQTAREDRERELLELEARAHLEVVRKQQEAAIIDVEPVFDPRAEAKKRRESEVQKAQIDASYKEQYGDKNPKGQYDDVVKLIDGLRGTLGGIFGPIVGGILDLASALYSDAAKDKYEQELLAEAHRTTEAVHGVRDAIKDAATPSPPPSEVKAGSEIPEVLPLTDEEYNKLPRSWQDTQEEYEFDLETGQPTVPHIPRKAPSVPTYHVPDNAPPLTEVAYSPGMEPPPVQATAGADAAAGEATAAGGGMAGAMSGLAAARPIIVAGIAVTRAVDEAVKGVLRGVGGVLQGIASANADPSVPLAAMGDAASSAGEKLTYFIPAVGLSVMAMGEMTKSFAGLMRALDQTAQRYGEYSPDIAQAQGLADIRQTIGDMERSQQIGPELAKYVDAQSQLQQTVEDVKVGLLEEFLPLVTGAVETVNQIAKDIAEIFHLTRKKDIMTPIDALLDPRFRQTEEEGGFLPNL